MNAGRELDALVATKVMGFSADRDTRPYSVQIEAAWEVVENLSGRGFEMHRMSDGYCVVFGGVPYPFKPVTVEAETAPLAICLAALQAVGAAGLPRGGDAAPEEPPDGGQPT